MRLFFKYLSQGYTLIDAETEAYKHQKTDLPIFGVGFALGLWNSPATNVGDPNMKLHGLYSFGDKHYGGTLPEIVQILRYGRGSAPLDNDQYP